MTLLADAATLARFEQDIGLRVTEGSRARLTEHLAERLQKLGCASLDEYLATLASDSARRAAEFERIAAVLTTPETFFNRDVGQMQLLREVLLPRLIAERRRAGNLRLRLWSCACSTGEEPYSLAILLDQLLPDRADWHIELLASDINPVVLQQAATAEYGPWSFRGCDAAFRTRWFEPAGSRWRLRPGLRQMVRLFRFDLLNDPLPAAALGLAEVDLLICRNLFIYLSAERVRFVADRLAATLAPSGMLLTGHGELRGSIPDTLQADLHPQSVVYTRRLAADNAHPARNSGAPADGGSGSGPAAAARPDPATPRAVVRRPSMQHSRSTARDTMPAERRAAQQAVVEAPALLAEAWRLADAGQLVAARAAVQRLRQQQPMLPEVHLLDAVVALESGATAAARAALRRALYLDPGMIAAHVNLELLFAGTARQRAAGQARATLARLLAGLDPAQQLPWLGELSARELAQRLGLPAAGAPPVTKE